MRLHTLLQGLWPSYSGPDPEIQALRYDSRQVGPGDLYVAVPGTRADGHDFIEAALQRGAQAIVCSQSWFAQQAPTAPIAWLPVADTRSALATLSAQFYGQPAQSMTLFGITGTNGKTTVAHLLSQLLSGLGLSTGWIGTLGAGYGEVRLPGQYTTPFPPELQAWLAQMQQAGVQAVAMECSSHALHQQRLGALAYDVAVFTNLSQDHLDYHLTLAAYAEAKALLFCELLKPGGRAVINLDDPWAPQFIAASRAPVLGFSLQDPSATLYASELVSSPEGVTFQLSYQGQSQPCSLRLSGRYNVANALAALGAVLAQQQALKIDLDAALAVLQTLSGVPGRLERVSPDGHPFAVYVDYAHTPDSLANVLQAVRSFTTGQLRVLFGCGGDRDRGKRPLMAQAAERFADQLMISSDNPRSEDPRAIIEQILAGLQAPAAAQVQADREQAIAQVLGQAQAGDTVIIAGKGHETYQLIGEQTLNFDDRAVARKYLNPATSTSPGAPLCPSH